jgi:hypothetical protein
MQFSKYELQGNLLLMESALVFYAVVAVAVHSIYLNPNARENMCTSIASFISMEVFHAFSVFPFFAVLAFGILFIEKTDTLLLVSLLPNALPQANPDRQ